MPYVTQCLKDAPGVFVAASDYLKVLPDAIDRWMPRKIRALGTDGFGRSEDRQSLRDFFEVDARFVVLATLSELLEDGQIDASVVQQAIKDLAIKPRRRIPPRAETDDVVLMVLKGLKVLDAGAGVLQVLRCSTLLTSTPSTL